MVVVDHERGLGLVAAGPPLVARPGDELVAQLGHERDAIDHVDGGEVGEFRLGQRRLGGEEPAIDAGR